MCVCVCVCVVGENFSDVVVLYFLAGVGGTGVCVFVCFFNRGFIVFLYIFIFLCRT